MLVHKLLTLLGGGFIFQRIPKPVEEIARGSREHQYLVGNHPPNTNMLTLVGGKVVESITLLPGRAERKGIPAAARV